MANKKEKEFIKDPKTNEEKIKEKINKVLNNIDEVQEKEDRKNRRKTIILTIGILLEIIIIIWIINSRYIKKKEPIKYKVSIKCNKETELDNVGYKLRDTNIYYLDKIGMVKKKSVSVIYIFKNKEYYDRFKSDYVASEKKEFKGIEKINEFDDVDYIYKEETIYDYDLLLKNKDVTKKGNVLNLNFKNKKDNYSILIESYDDVLSESERLDYICE